jgi:hypothetical protein
MTSRNKFPVIWYFNRILGVEFNKWNKGYYLHDFENIRFLYLFRNFLYLALSKAVCTQQISLQSFLPRILHF